MIRRYPTDEEAKAIICSIGRKMYDKGFVAANDGNITVRVGDNAFWVTPTGVSKGDLVPEMLIKVDRDGNVLEGTYRPTSELKMHLRVYKENDELVSTCHTHSPYALAFACAGVELDVAYSPEPTGIVGIMPIAPYACPGTDQLADSIAPYCNTHNGCLIANHGVMTWGYTPEEAWHRAEALEAYCRLAIILECFMGRAHIMSNAQISELLEHHQTRITSTNRLKGVDETMNTEPAVRLSEITTLRDRGPLGAGFSDEILDVLATKIAKKLAEELRERL